MASTYVNDLRLEEMANGENSGTWGTKTNVNLELIGEALGFGTRAIADASTDNITIGDGVSDADRAMFLNLTGGGQACTITLLPNTSSKVWIMNNATSYALTFTQGSGANVIIAAGQTKIIATDGGAGSAVVYEVGALTLNGDVTSAGTFKPLGDTAAGDLAAVGYTSVLGAILTGQGSTNDVTLVNDADGTVLSIPTGTTNVDVVGDVTGANFQPDGDTAAGDNAAFGYTSVLGAILTGQGSTNDVTLVNDADATVLGIPTGTVNVTMAGTLDVVGVAAATTFEPDGDTAAGDNAAIGYTAAEGLILTGQGSTNDVTIKNDADADVIEIPTGTVNVTMAGTLDVVGDVTGGNFQPDGDTAAGDTAALGYTAALGAILTGQGSTNDVTLVNDADATVLGIPTGTTNVDIVGTATASTFEPDGDTAAGDNAAIGYTAALGLILTGQGSTNDVTIVNDADATVLGVPTGTTNVAVAGNIVLADASSVNISTPLLAGTDETFTGLSAQMLAGGAIAAFKLVCIHTTTQEVVTADASAYATARVLGIAPAAISDTATGTVLLHGFIRDDTFAFTAGSTLYLSETAGAMTHTAPSTDGAFVNVVGVALSPDVVYINPSMDVIEHA